MLVKALGNESLTTEYLRNYVDKINKGDNSGDEVVNNMYHTIINAFNTSGVNSILFEIFDHNKFYFNQQLFPGTSRNRSMAKYRNKNATVQDESGNVVFSGDALKKLKHKESALKALETRIHGSNEDASSGELGLEDFYQCTEQALVVQLTNLRREDVFERKDDIIHILMNSLGYASTVINSETKPLIGSIEEDQLKNRDEETRKRIKQFIAEKLSLKNRLTVKFGSSADNVNHDVQNINLALQLYINPEVTSMFEDALDEDGDLVTVPTRIPFYFYKNENDKERFQKILRNVLIDTYNKFVYEYISENIKPKSFKNKALLDRYIDLRDMLVDAEDAKIADIPYSENNDERHINGKIMKVDYKYSDILMMPESDEARHIIDDAEKLLNGPQNEETTDKLYALIDKREELADKEANHILSNVYNDNDEDIIEYSKNFTNRAEIKTSKEFGKGSAANDSRNVQELVYYTLINGLIKFYGAKYANKGNNKASLTELKRYKNKESLENIKEFIYYNRESLESLVRHGINLEYNGSEEMDQFYNSLLFSFFSTDANTMLKSREALKDNIKNLMDKAYNKFFDNYHTLLTGLGPTESKEDIDNDE